MEGTIAGSSRDEWARGWTLALAACAGMMISPLAVYTMGGFMV